MANSIERWSPGAVSTYTTAGIGTAANSLANGTAIMGTAQIDNSVNLDEFGEFSIALGTISSGAGAPYVGVFGYPLNADGTSYGDGGYVAAAPGPPNGYLLGNIPVRAATNAAVVGSIRFLMPQDKFKYVVHNALGAAFGTAMTFSHRTFNRQIGT